MILEKSHPPMKGKSGFTTVFLWLGLAIIGWTWLGCTELQSLTDKIRVKLTVSSGPDHKDQSLSVPK